MEPLELHRETERVISVRRDKILQQHGQNLNRSEVEFTVCKERPVLQRQCDSHVRFGKSKATSPKNRTPRSKEVVAERGQPSEYYQVSSQIVGADRSRLQGTATTSSQPSTIAASGYWEGASSSSLLRHRAMIVGRLNRPELGRTAVGEFVSHGDFRNNAMMSLSPSAHESYEVVDTQRHRSDPQDGGVDTFGEALSSCPVSAALEATTPRRHFSGPLVCSAEAAVREVVRFVCTMPAADGPRIVQLGLALPWGLESTVQIKSLQHGIVALRVTPGVGSADSKWLDTELHDALRRRGLRVERWDSQPESAL